MLLDQDITKRIELRKTVKIKVMVIRYRGTPPSLAVAKWSAHTRYSILLCWWRRWWFCWWRRLVVPLPRHRLTIIEGWSSLLKPQIYSQTHPLESIFILTVLILQVIDLGLEVLDFLMKLEDGLPNVLDVQLVVVVNFVISMWLASIPRSTISWHLKTCCSIASSLVSTLPVLLGPSTSRMCSTPSCISMVWGCCSTSVR